MFKITPLSSALAVLMAASVLSGCGGGNVESVSSPTTPRNDAQTNTDREAAKTADVAATKAAAIAKPRSTDELGDTGASGLSG